MLPGPVSRHDIGVPSLAVCIFTVWDVIDAIGEVWVGEDIVDHLSRVPVPDLVFCGHPLGHGTVVGPEAIEPSGVRPPGYVTKFDCVDGRVKVVVIGEWCGVAVRYQGGTPDAEKVVDDAVG